MLREMEGMTVEFAVVGGDARFAYLTRLLCSAGRDARLVGVPRGVPNVPCGEPEVISQAKNVVSAWPMPEGCLERLRPGARAYFCGPGEPEGLPEGVAGINLWKDERLLLENAWLTAEGAISAAMTACDASLRDCHCLVVGWGRIGRALTELLIGMSVRVTVASRSEKGRNGAIERGAESVSTYALPRALPGKKIVFSTPPQRVLDAQTLKAVDRDALVIDLSSPPYGMDLEAAQALGLNAWREPRLPGRYCPYSAAQALLRALERAEGRG